MEGATGTLNDGTIKAGSFAIYDQGKFTINGGHVVANTTAVQIKGTETESGPLEMLTVNDGLIEALGDGVAINFHSNAAGTINGGTIKAMYPDPEQKKVD